MRLIPVFLVLAFLAGCAIVDTQEGALWTSSVQVVKDEQYRPGTVVAVERFSLPDKTATSTVKIYDSGYPFILPVHHTYAFNSTDQANLRESVVRSLRGSGVEVIDLAADGNKSVPAGAKILGVEVVSVAMDGNEPLIQANISVTGDGVTKKDWRFVRAGPGLGSPKNRSLRNFVLEVHRSLRGAL